MIDFRELSDEVFLILRSYSDDIILYDDLGNRTYEPSDATRMYAQDVGVLVSVVSDDINSRVKLHINGEDQIRKFFNLIQSMRAAAISANVMFSVRNTGDSVTPDKHTRTAGLTESTRENICEGMYGTSHSSYLKYDNAKLIVRHSKPVREGVIGARGRAIREIHVEDISGNRFAFPVKSLLGAKAFTQHINHGGSFADAVSSQIVRMASDYTNLRSGISAIENQPNAIMPNGLHLSVSIVEAQVALRKKLTALSLAEKYNQAVASLGMITESSESLITEITAASNGKLSEEIIMSIVRNTPRVIAESDNNAKDRDVQPNESGWADSGDGAVSESSRAVQDSMAIFESWMDSVTAMPVVEPTVELPQEPTPTPLEDAPRDDQEDQANALIAAINMAQEALVSALRSTAGEFATTPAHLVVSDHIIPAISAAITDRKNAYDNLVAAVDAALTSGDQTALVTMLDVAATAYGYDSFAEFSFSASIGEFIAPEQYGNPEVEVEQPQSAPVEQPATEEPAPVTQIITDSAVDAVATSVGVGQKAAVGEKTDFALYGEWAHAASKLPASERTKFTVWVGEAIAAKWHVATNSGWVSAIEYVTAPLTNESDVTHNDSVGYSKMLSKAQMIKDDFLDDIDAKEVSNVIDFDFSK